MPKHHLQTLLALGLTAVFVGYLMVWLPGPAAGLTLLGLEMGEWVKFLGVGPGRNLFYLPPITLGLMLLLWSLHWPSGRWQTWAMRGTAVAVSLLAFPAVGDLQDGASRNEYMGRLQWIGLVAAIALLSGPIGSRLRGTWPWLLLALAGVAGAILPTGMYLQLRPAVAQVVGSPPGIGWGVWLNGIGHLLVTAVSLWFFVSLKNTKRR